MVLWTLFSVTPSHVAGLGCIISQVSGASRNLIPRALLLVLTVRLRVVRVDTFRLCTSHLRHLRTDRVGMAAGEPATSWAPYFVCYATCHTPSTEDLELGQGSSSEHAGATWRPRGRTAHAVPCPSSSLSLSNASLCCAVSPFESLVRALSDPNIKGTDSSVRPLTQSVLDTLIADAAAMTSFVQHHFVLNESPDQLLSHIDASSLANAALAYFRKGVLLLQPYTLGRACATMLVSPHRRMVCPGLRSHFPCCGHPCGTALSPRPIRYGGVHGAAARGWCHCTRSRRRCGVVLLCISRGRLHECSCDALCHVQPLMVCHLVALGPRAGAWACDVQAPGQGPAQRPGQLLLVCPVAFVPPTRALRSPAVQVVAVRQVRKSSCRVKQFHIRSPILCPS